MDVSLEIPVIYDKRLQVKYLMPSLMEAIWLVETDKERYSMYVSKMGEVNF